MAIFEVTGGKQLKGDIIPQGAKNEALQILCAVLLTPEKVVISNIPDIVDINKLIDLLRDLGVKVEKTGHEEYTFQSDEIKVDYLVSPEFKKKGGGLRGSTMIIGPMLARFGVAYMPKPGGDKIGRRRMDTHFIGFENLGAKFEYDSDNENFKVTATKLKGAYMLLDEASVTGTANIVMAAVLAEGVTTIYNAACEPYLQQLCKMLNRMGAKITGVGSNLLTIEGVTSLKGTEHRILPDMIEIGSFIGLAAMTQSEITIKDVSYDNLGCIPKVFSRLGIQMERRGDDIYIPSQEHYEIDSFIDGSMLTVADAIWPGFTPDLFFVDKLIDMGAQIILCDPHRATVMGLDRKVQLRAIQMASPDIRAGVALLIAAMSAKGKSTIFNINQIDRGYQNIDGRLNAIGAEIIRKNN